MIVLSDMTFDVRVYKEAKSLAARGHSVRVLSYKYGVRTSVFAVDGFTTHQVGLPARGVQWTISTLPILLWFTLRFIWAALATRAEVYHAHNPNTLPLAWLAAKLRGAKLVYDSHELWQSMSKPEGWKRTLKYLAEKNFERWLAPRADVVLTVNEYYAEQIGAALPVPRPLVIHNYPELVEQQPSAWLRDRLHLDPAQRIVLYQGGFWLDTRAIENLVRAVQHFPADTVLALVGFGRPEDIQRLHDLAAAQGSLNRNVFILEAVPHQDLPLVTMSADIGAIPFLDLSPAMQFCTPNKIYEYLMAGLPVVSTDLPSLRSVILPNGVGEVFDPLDPEDMAGAVSRLVHAGLEAAKARARRLAVEQFHWGNEGERLNAAYEALGQPGGAGLAARQGRFRL